MIRPVRSEDVPALRRMMAGSNGYAEGPPRDMIVRYAATWAPEGKTFVLEDEAGLAGFYELIGWGERDCELEAFFTADDRQGRGVGRVLFDHMAGQARAAGAKAVLICSNPGAAEFYRRMGARDAGVKPPSDAITWERPKLVLTL
ncbi:GNAT family N-acetyltransferase [Caulobacter sp. 17J80-11]|uniref:GNAT family N-acetyltransferase n=1 Tax=Caulobacter sp. 17J80-11 TaxID=2763502 RepID=UPI0016536BF3|nr:GNAT family N-acetyltransferase [Caulobacter sp. 17J80-11]MBC6980848.1 GNAT family N-acetyltransferase [Caulobacter sp. 17J80-11]